jgi:hypothetical protein
MLTTSPTRFGATPLLPGNAAQALRLDAIARADARAVTAAHADAAATLDALRWLLASPHERGAKSQMGRDSARRRGASV